MGTDLQCNAPASVPSSHVSQANSLFVLEWVTALLHPAYFSCCHCSRAQNGKDVLGLRTSSQAPQASLLWGVESGVEEASRNLAMYLVCLEIVPEIPSFQRPMSGESASIPDKHIK